MVPAPRFESFEALNAWLEAQCLQRQNDIVRGHSATIGERLLRDHDALMALPPTPYCCNRHNGKPSDQHTFQARIRVFDSLMRLSFGRIAMCQSRPLKPRLKIYLSN